jgi:HlyD family secretion protein
LHWSPSSLAGIAPDVRSQIQADPVDDSSTPDRGVKKSESVIWIKDGDYVRPVQVQVGITDGVNTAVNAADLREGAVVVTGEMAGRAQTGARNPFLPVLRH